jgi:methoxymalonate biosynthesis protein
MRRMKRPPDQEYLAVIGAGVMGTSITAMALGHSVDVVLIDKDASQLDRARRQISQQLRHGRLLSQFPSDLPAGQLETSTEIDMAGTTIAVIESITENGDLKRVLLRQVSDHVRPGTPLISNTSSIPIDELAQGLPRPEDVAGVHFMNPAYLIKMVEVIRGPRTAQTTMERVKSLLKALDRQVIVVNDNPGFVTSRLLHPMLNDAARLAHAGVATVESIDSLMTGCLGHPVGPLRTADLIGLDNLVDSLEALYERTGEEHFRPCDMLLDKVKTGHLGRKTGRGFYEYQGG